MLQDPKVSVALGAFPSYRMGDISINVLVTPEKTEPEGGNLRKNSTGTIGIQSSGIKIQSRYLRASTGSCHDLCKYGRKHAEAKKKLPITKRITVKPGEGHDLTNNVTLAARKKKPVINLKPSDSETKMPDIPPIIRREVFSSAKKAAVTMQQVSSPGKEVDVSAKPASTLKLKPVQRKLSLPTVLECLSSRGNNEVNFRKPTGLLQTNPVGGLSSRRKSKTGMRQDLGASVKGEMKVLVASTISASPKPSVKRAMSIKAGTHTSCKNLKRVSPLKNQNNVSEPELKEPSNEEVPEKTLYIIEPTGEYKTMGHAQNGVRTTPSSASSENKRWRCAGNGSHSTQLSLSSKKKSSRQTRNGIQTTSLSLSSSASSENKSLRRIRTGTLASQSSSSSMLLSSLAMSPSEYTHSEENGTSSEHVETKIENQVANPEVENKSSPKKCGIISLDDKDCSPQKMSFRRGKVVDLQSENNTPRRLRFRQGRVLGEKQNGKDDPGRRSFKKREVDDGELDGPEAESEKVVLRHQDVQGKKDAQSLFNNVIEETASKLVETKKSKVKALVGAFETVISLQEIKPLATTTS